MGKRLNFRSSEELLRFLEQTFEGALRRERELNQRKKQQDARRWVRPFAAALVPVSNWLSKDGLSNRMWLDSRRVKNAIDWASRPFGDSAWSGKPAAIMGASIGAIGTARAQYHLRQIFVLNSFPEYVSH